MVALHHILDACHNHDRRHHSRHRPRPVQERFLRLFAAAATTPSAPCSRRDLYRLASPPRDRTLLSASTPCRAHLRHINPVQTGGHAMKPHEPWALLTFSSIVLTSGFHANATLAMRSASRAGSGPARAETHLQGGHSVVTGARVEPGRIHRSEFAKSPCAEALPKEAQKIRGDRFAKTHETQRIDESSHWSGQGDSQEAQFAPDHLNP